MDYLKLPCMCSFKQHMNYSVDVDGCWRPWWLTLMVVNVHGCWRPWLLTVNYLNLQSNLRTTAVACWWDHSCGGIFTRHIILIVHLGPCLVFRALWLSVQACQWFLRRRVLHSLYSFYSITLFMLVLVNVVFTPCIALILLVSLNISACSGVEQAISDPPKTLLDQAFCLKGNDAAPPSNPTDASASVTG